MEEQILPPSLESCGLRGICLGGVFWSSYHEIWLLQLETYLIFYSADSAYPKMHLGKMQEMGRPVSIPLKLEIAWKDRTRIGNGHRINPHWQAHAGAGIHIEPLGLSSVEHGLWGSGQAAVPLLPLLCSSHLS